MIKIQREPFYAYKFPALPKVQGLKEKGYTTAWHDQNSNPAVNPPSPPCVQSLETRERDAMPGKAKPHKKGCHWPMLHCTCVGRRT